MKEKVNQGSVREGRLIKSVTYDFTFKIPQNWIDWNENHPERPSLHLTLQELSLVKESRADWDKEFSMLANAMLPFGKCTAQVGEEGWGDQGIRFNDLQVRTYVLNEPIGEIEKKRIRDGNLAVEEITGKPSTFQGEDAGDWKKVVFKYFRSYEDYGATAIEELRFQQFKDFVVVFVFMYTDHTDVSEEIREILQSVSVNKE